MAKRKNEDDADACRMIELVVVDQEEKRTYFNVRRDTQMKKVFTSYGLKYNLSPKATIFVYEGKGIATNTTPDKLGMEDGDEISAMESKMGA